jgi:predicted HTH domain antitoxin
MCKVVEDMINEEVKNEMMEVALRLIEEGTLPLEKIAECCQLTVAEIEKLAEEN